MKKTTVKTIPFLLVAGMFLIIMSAFGLLQPKPWNVPDAAKNKKNPVAANTETVNAGKALWATHCKSCHGNKGLGDGSKAGQLKTEPGNFSTATFQSQSDGSIFYKTSEGRDDMPGFKKKITDADEIWSIINFMRTLKK
jgi:mono/diheme cytochrome c family protein